MAGFRGFYSGIGGLRTALLVEDQRRTDAYWRNRQRHWVARSIRYARGRFDDMGRRYGFPPFDGLSWWPKSTNDTRLALCRRAVEYLAPPKKSNDVVADEPPCVGIFWGCPTAEDGLELLADKTPVSQAEEYGDCITHSMGHAEFWGQLSRIPAWKLERQGISLAPHWCKYDLVPRGRVVFWPRVGRFVIYADRRLQSAAFIAQIVTAFRLPPQKCEVRSDPHYRAIPDLDFEVKDV